MFWSHNTYKPQTTFSNFTEHQWTPSNLTLYTTWPDKSTDYMAHCEMNKVNMVLFPNIASIIHLIRKKAIFI
jgi:hypothetical protein